MKNHGFSLIECAIYCCILMIMSVITFTFIARTLTTIGQSNEQIQKALWLEAAHDLLRVDIQEASCDIGDWRIDGQQFICKGVQEWYGWRLKGESLYRIKGIYSNAMDQWSHKSESLVARQVQLFKPSLQSEDGLVKAVRYVLGVKNGMPQEQTVYLMNGVCI
jgi:hypothetical protein